MRAGYIPSTAKSESKPDSGDPALPTGQEDFWSRHCSKQDAFYWCCVSIPHFLQNLTIVTFRGLPRATGSACPRQESLKCTRLHPSQVVQSQRWTARGLSEFNCPAFTETNFGVMHTLALPWGQAEADTSPEMHP